MRAGYDDNNPWESYSNKKYCHINDKMLRKMREDDDVYGWRH